VGVGGVTELRKGVRCGEAGDVGEGWEGGRVRVYFRSQCG